MGSDNSISREQHIINVTNRFYSTGPLDKDAVIAAAKKVYKTKGIAFPKKVVYHTNFIRMIEERSKERSVKEVHDSLLMGTYSSYYFGYREWLDITGKEPMTDTMKALRDLHALVGAAIMFDDVLHIADKPVSHVVPENKLASEIPFTTEDPLQPHHSIGDHNVYIFNGIALPTDIIERIKRGEKVPTKDILAETNVEIRQELIRIVGAKQIVQDTGAKVIEELSGEDLYNKYPIGKYVQQGDLAIFPVDEDSMSLSNPPLGATFASNKFDARTKIRLRNGVFYKLYSMDLGDGITGKCLHMGNPSVTGDEHFEFVDDDVENIFEAIVFRNYSNLGTCGEVLTVEDAKGNKKEVLNSFSGKDYRHFIEAGTAYLPSALS